jgi:hypothetical protein
LNVRGLFGKENKLEGELKKMKADVTITTETEKKLKGTNMCNIIYYFIVEYSKKDAQLVA